jgi:3-oxoacyl-[acyl-carrier-protein] synthase-1
LIELADAAVRTQLCLIQEHGGYRDGAGVPVRASFFPAERPFDTQRWSLLMLSALTPLIRKLREYDLDAVTHATCLWLVLPDPSSRPGVPADLLEQMREALLREFPVWRQIQILTGGHAAGVAALEQAAAVVKDLPGVIGIVLGVESGLSSEALMWLDMQSLLHGAHRAAKGEFRREPHGRIPGEGAAALALSAPMPQSARGWAQLLGCGLAHEPITYSVPKPCIGAGLTQAARVALGRGREHNCEPVGGITVDLNGEPYRADQFGFTALRLGEVLHPRWQRVTPALASGDLGAASAVAHVALAAYAMQRSSQNTSHLILASSDDPLRGAVLLGPAELLAAHMEERA